MLIPLAFSPYDYTIIAIFSLACLFYIVWHSSIATAALYGYVFGFGMFAVGISWLHISINLFGGFSVTASWALTTMLVAFLALYPALCAYTYQYFFSTGNIIIFVLVMPILWLFSEWLRSWIFTGFPWLNIGYSQIDTPTALLAPVLGVYGISYLTALLAVMLAAFFLVSYQGKLVLIVMTIIILGSLNLLSDLNWTHEKDSISVALIQGGIPQELKWRPEQKQKTLDTYLSLSADYKNSQLIVWPETAVPAFYHQVENFIEKLKKTAQQDQTDYLIGLPFIDRQLNKFYNGMVVIGSSDDIYYKRHLVPFGEYLPWANLLRPLSKLLGYTMTDFSSGTDHQPVVHAANQVIGVSICYESIFGEEIIEALPEANLLVNISNDAWFGDSIGPHQHLQMSRMRAIETGRYMLRATNNGISAIIDDKGNIVQRSPQFIHHAISSEIKTFDGLTPFARFGNMLILVPALLLFIVLLNFSYLRLKKAGHYSCTAKLEGVRRHS